MKHEDDGSNRCQSCLEEWPCTNRQKGGYGNSGIDQWRSDDQLRRMEERQEKTKQKTVRVNEWFKSMGIDREWNEWGGGQVFDCDEIIEIMEKTSVNTNTRGAGQDGQ